MSCTYCSAETTGTDSTTCRHCAQLVAKGMWQLLAYSWLHNRPEDWVPDVAGFLEYTVGLGAELPRLSSSAVKS